MTPEVTSISVRPKDLIITILDTGDIDIRALHKAIRKWEASSAGMAYPQIIDTRLELELNGGLKTENLLIFLGGWKIESKNDISLVNGRITGRDKNKKYYNPIGEDSPGQIIEKELESNNVEDSSIDWQPSEEQIQKAKEGARIFSQDWEVIASEKLIRRKTNAQNKIHTLHDLYWFLKESWISNDELNKFAFPIKASEEIPSKGVVRTYGLTDDWNIYEEDLKYLSKGILSQSGKTLINDNRPNNISESEEISDELVYRDKYEVNPVLGVRDLAKVLADIIEKMSNDKGKMIGVLGKWGRGKTFLLNQLWSILEKSSNGKGQNKYINVELHAWKYTDTPAIWAYLYEQFADAYYSDPIKGWFSKIRKRVVLNIYRSGTSALKLFFLSLLFSIILSFGVSFEYKISWLNRIITSLGVGTLISVIYIYFKHKNTALELFKKYYADTSFEHVLGIQAEVHKELKNLLKALKYFGDDKKVILFVEDIDRCPEEKIIGIVDSLRVMLEDEDISKRVIVITAIDGDILSRAIMDKYSHSVGIGRMNNEADIINRELSKITSEYLDKLFLVSLKLGRLNPSEVNEFFEEITRLDLPQKENNIGKKIKEVVDKNITSGGGTVIDPVIKNSNQQSIRLSEKEYDMLKIGLLGYEDVTPRQIRIFYFRYLLARNLLEQFYSLKGNNNIWKDDDKLNIFIGLLISYSTKSKDLSHDLSEIAKNSNKDKIINTIAIQSDDYYELLKVLDMVVAY